MSTTKKYIHCEFFEDQNREHETFVYGWGTWSWDIDEAKKIVEGREPKKADINDVREAVDYPIQKNEDGTQTIRIDKIHVCEEHLDHVDPDQPIIIGWWPSWTNLDTNLVLDGHHRIARNIRDETGRIFFHLLTREESDSICTDNRKYKNRLKKSKVFAKK